MNVPSALQDARAVPNGASILCSKLHGPNTVILGDAAHGVTPALGQGCNSALESAVILSEVSSLLLLSEVGLGERWESNVRA